VYTPNAKSRQILARAIEHIRGVPYRVTARWLFYRLYQEGLYAGKTDYNNRFLPLLSRARHNLYGEWHPDTLADDTRKAIERGGGFATPGDWADAMRKRAHCGLSKWAGQENYVELWFEAKAMRGQFEHYTEHITLRPFGGQPSIPYKWDIAKALEWADENYGLSIKVLYFGDLDPAGMLIAEVTERDVRKWCDAEFEFIRCGLNPGDEIKYNLPDSIEGKGYQWEALTDTDASDIIMSHVDRYVDPVTVADVLELERGTTVRFRKFISGFEA